MQSPLAFLSYTRKDDEFFGGYITEFRKFLESGVQVVTGERSFQIFQDIEGIVIGENWQKKLAEVIDGSSFFIPMLSPLYFNSTPCREEAQQFLEHEKVLKRDDLILPIYFLTTAKLEKDEEKAKDSLATELARRQMFDWRERANIPLEEARPAVVELARAIEKAIPRLEAGRPRAEHDHKVVTAGFVSHMRRQELIPRTVLWVDDNPDNNSWERTALESYGVSFVLAQDTVGAQRMLEKEGPFAAIVSDMGRAGDPLAGYTLLSKVGGKYNHVPYFIYTTAGFAATLGHDAKERGAQGITSDPDELVEMVVTAIR